MSEYRSRILGLLYLAAALTCVLGVVGSTESRASALILGAVSLVLLPTCYYGVYFILYMQVKNYYMSTRTLRQACGLCVLFFGGFMLFAPLLSLYAIIHGSQPLPPVIFFLGAPLAAFRIWSRYLEGLKQDLDGVSRLANYSINPPAGGGHVNSS